VRHSEVHVSTCEADRHTLTLTPALSLALTLTLTRTLA